MILNGNLAIFLLDNKVINIYVFEIFHNNLHIKHMQPWLEGWQSAVFTFPAVVQLLLHINKLMTKSHRELPTITGWSGGRETRFSTSPSRGFWQLLMRLDSSFHSPLLFIPLTGIFLICLFSAIPFSSFSINDPWGLAGLEQSLVNQDLRRGGEDPRHHAGFQTARRQRCASTCLCVHARALQQGVVSAGQPHTGVGCRGRVGNEAEKIPLTPF